MEAAAKNMRDHCVEDFLFSLISNMIFGKKKGEQLGWKTSTEAKSDK